MIKEYFGWLIGMVILIVVFSAVSLGIKYYGQPISRHIDQKTFMESQQYIDGAVRDLSHYQLEYKKGDNNTKEMIQSTVQHQFANFPSEKVPMYLQPFYSSMMSGGDFK